MLTLLLPPLLGLVLQGMMYRRKDRQVSRKPYTLGRHAYAACLFGLWFQIAVTMGLAAWVEGILFQKEIAWRVWGMWCVALMPTIARRLQHLGWPAWPALFFGLPTVPAPGFGYLTAPLLVWAGLLLFATTKRTATDAGAWSATFHMPALPGISDQERGRLELITQSPFAEDANGRLAVFSERPGGGLDLRRSMGPITCAYAEDDERKTVGPYELPIILHLWDNGHLNRDALYWHAQLPRWLPLAQDVEMLRQKLGIGRWSH